MVIVFLAALQPRQCSATASSVSATISAQQGHVLGQPISKSCFPPSAGLSQASPCSAFAPQSTNKKGSLKRRARVQPLHSIPASKVQEAAAVVASRESPSPVPVTPKTGSEWSAIVRSLTHPDSFSPAPTPHNTEKLICLSEALNSLPEAEVQSLTEAPGSLAAFLNLVSAIAPHHPDLQDLYLHIGEAFLRPQLQEAVATDSQLSTAADAVVATATYACEDSFWHPDIVASAAHLQLVFCRGHRAFWNLLAHHTDCLHECDAHSFSRLAECAAALRVRHPTVWTHLATSTNTLALHMSPSDLHACVRALGATIPNTPAAAAPDMAQANAVQGVNLNTVLEVVQWRGGQGFDAADLPYTALAAAAILFQSLPDTAAGGVMAAEAACMAERAPEFWLALVRQSREACGEGYGSRDSLNMALACAAAEMYFEKVPHTAGESSEGGWGAAGREDGGEGGGAGGSAAQECCRVLREHAAEMMRFAALAAVVEGGSGDGEDWDSPDESSSVDEDCRVECMEVWLEVLVGCAGASVPLGVDLLPGAARVVNAVHGMHAFDSAVAVAALLRVACAEAQAADEQHRPGIETLMHDVLHNAAANNVCMGPMHATEVLEIVVREVPSAVGERADAGGVRAWLLGEVRGQLAGLSETWLTRFMRAAAAVPGALDEHEDIQEELRACLQSKTFTPRDCYDFSGVVNREFFADNRRELAPEHEGLTPQWRSAHGRNAPGFTPSEAAEAARCCKALALFDGGSAVLEALLAASMGGAAAPPPRPRGACRGGLQSAFQQLLQDEIDSLGGVEIKWIAEQRGDAELLRASCAGALEVTRESGGVYSALAAASMGACVGGAAGGSSWEDEDGAGYRFEGWYDGEGAEKVSRVMDESGAAVLEVMEALESADWDVEAAVEALREAQEGAQAAGGAQAGAE